MIKEEIVEYRNTHKESRTLLGTLLGELDRKTKTPTDDDCIQVIKKMIESNVLCGETEENEILEKFLPQQLNEDQIKAIISTIQAKNIGECMKFFKENCAGRYDGKLVSKLFTQK